VRQLNTPARRSPSQADAQGQASANAAKAALFVSDSASMTNCPRRRAATCLQRLLERSIAADARGAVGCSEPRSLGPKSAKRLVRSLPITFVMLTNGILGGCIRCMIACSARWSEPVLQRHRDSARISAARQMPPPRHRRLLPRECPFHLGIGDARARGARGRSSIVPGVGTEQPPRPSPCRLHPAPSCRDAKMTS